MSTGVSTFKVKDYIPQHSSSYLKGKYKNLFQFERFNKLQSACINQILNLDSNFVVSAPTGSGKTTIFELAIVKLDNKGLAIYLAPTKALCSERYGDWNRRFSSFGIECQVLTGDSEAPPEIIKKGIIVTTPEKLDAITRTKSSLKKICDVVKLLMIDEIHSVGDSRGATLEAVVSRMKALKDSPRLIGISATIGNLEDFRRWFSTKDVEAIAFNYGENKRPVPIQRHVFGFPSKGMNPFQFENSLTHQLRWIINKFSDGLPTLVFCSTRRSAESTAFFLAKATKSFESTQTFTEPKLNKLVPKGVAFHNAGLPIEDRRTIEYLFLNGKLKVLCTTSTLAVGVNLPAHLVIIKGTKQYTSRGYEDYNVMGIQQMEGRAGRPQYDTFGVSVILTTEELKHSFMSDPSMSIINSHLMGKLAESIAAEISLGNIFDLDSCANWMQSTFFGIRNDQEIQNHMSIAIRKLKRIGLIECQGKQLICSGWNECISKYSLSLHSSEVLLSVPVAATHDVLLGYISRSFDREDCRAQPGDKSFLKRVSSLVKYKLKGQEFEAWHKPFYVIQAELAKDEDLIKMTSSISQYYKRIIPKAKKLSHCLSEILFRKGATIALRNSLELQGAITAEMWHEGKGVLRQIDGIGPAYASSLYNMGLCTIKDILGCEANKIDIGLRRNPPFGLQVINSCKQLPILSLETKFAHESSQLKMAVEYSAKVISRSQLHLLILKKNGIGNITKVAYETWNHEICNQHEFIFEEWDSSDELYVSWICTSAAGLNVHRILRCDGDLPAVEETSPVELTLKITDPCTNFSGSFGKEPNSIMSDVPEDKTSGEALNQPKVSAVKSPPHMTSPPEAICRHRCRDKLKCKHQCCKGIPNPKRRKSIDRPISGIQLASDLEPANQIQLKKVYTQWLNAFRFDGGTESEPTSEIRLPVTVGGSAIESFISYVSNIN